MLRSPIIGRMPVEALCTSEGELLSLAGRGMTVSEICDLLRYSCPSFAVADVGLPLAWIPEEKTFDYWKSEFSPRVAESHAFSISDFPGGYCYVASQWQSSSGNTVVLMEKYH
jgi:hypothetical protein